MQEQIKRRVEIHRLDRKVLAVAVEGAINDWAAYIGAVQGNDHTSEALRVKQHGTKLPREVAKLLFPNFKDLTWRA